MKLYPWHLTEEAIAEIEEEIGGHLERERLLISFSLPAVDATKRKKSSGDLKDQSRIKPQTGIAGTKEKA